MEEVVMSWMGEDTITSEHGRLLSSADEWKAKLWSRSSVESAMERAPFVVLVFIMLWYFNLVLLGKNKVNFEGVLGMKISALGFTLYCGSILAVLYLLIMYGCITLWESTVEFAVALFYGTAIASLMALSVPGVVALFPADAHVAENRSTFMLLCKNVVWPGQTVAFSEIVFADALTSLSKVFKDGAITIIAVYSSLTQTPITDLHEEGMLLVAVLASVPFLIRVRQCWVQFESQHDAILRVPIFLNIVKYMSAFPPIWLAAAATLGFYHPNLPTFIMLTTAVNSLYSFMWDICMDWGLLWYSLRDGKCGVRSRFLYPLIAYLLVSVFNLTLRFAWAANQFPSLLLMAGIDASSLVFVLELLEVLRRAVWNMFRIEWEIINTESRDKKAGGVEGDSDVDIVKGGTGSSSSNLRELRV